MFFLHSQELAIDISAGFWVGVLGFFFWLAVLVCMGVVC